MAGLVEPHGGELVTKILKGEKREAALEEVKSLKKIRPSLDVLMDAEKIAVGAFSPLEGFMNYEDLISVLENMRLSNGIPWTIPIVMLLDDDTSHAIKEGEKIGLWYDDLPIAVLEVEEKFKFDILKLVESTFATTDTEHPGVQLYLNKGNNIISGKIELINFVPHPWRKYELIPSETRDLFKKKGWKKIVAFQTRNAPHRAHEYLQRVAMEIGDGLLIQPILGAKKEGDYDNETILKAYEVLINNYFPKDKVVLSGLSTPMRYAGPREAVFHAIVRKNYGASHFMVGRDHAGVGNYYHPFAAHKIFDEFKPEELGVEIIKFGEVFYCEKCEGMASDKTCGHDETYRKKISMTKVRTMMENGEEPPREFIRPEVAQVLKEFFEKNSNKN